MIPGDLVKFKEGKGFSWWGDHIYINYTVVGVRFSRIPVR